MKAQKLTIVLTLVVLAALLAAGPAAARSTRTECTGSETVIGYLDEGTWTFPGGNIHVRGVVTRYQEESTCPELAGVTTSVMNAAWDADFFGPMWGTGRTETTLGAWEGHWRGMLTPEGCSYETVMHGVTGEVEGLKATLTADCSSPVSTWTATILDPHGD
jgi:hypothetical protein